MSAASAPNPIVRYDLTFAEKWAKDPARLRDAWDYVHAVAAVQGLVNRSGTRLYIRAIHSPEGGDIMLDDWWLDRLRSQGDWLDGRPITDVEDFDALVRHFRRSVHGLVVYDESVPATSCIASTIAGVDGLIPVRYDARPDSLFNRLRTTLKLPVKAWLIHPDGTPAFTGKGVIPGTGEPSTGSAKNDAYRWAISTLLDRGRCDAGSLAFYIDAAWLKNPSASGFWNHTLTNHDYFISKKAFFFDLSPWADEPATDDPGQKPGTDLETLKRILASAAGHNAGKRMTHIGGFIPWAFKYTDLVGGKHGGVPSEWEFSRVISAYNAYLDADALGLCAMANASFYSHQPLPAYGPEKPVAKVKPEPGKRYFAFYVGDWDSAAWLYQMLPTIWEDPARGTVPLGWAFNPNLAERFPAAFWYTRHTRTAMDTFIAGDSGAGYINPSELEEPRSSGLSSGVSLWEGHCANWYARFGLSITGFVIDGYAPPMPKSVLDAYARFSPKGTVAQKVPPLGMHNGMPLLQMSDDLSGSPEDAAGQIARRLKEDPRRFLIFRAVLKKPSWYAGVVAALKKTDAHVEVLEPYTFFETMKKASTQPPK
ncbi:MAG TPA: hypothetical protein VGM51_07815 [Armatimonadota bacterium]